MSALLRGGCLLLVAVSASLSCAEAGGPPKRAVTPEDIAGVRWFVSRTSRPMVKPSRMSSSNGARRTIRQSASERSGSRRRTAANRPASLPSSTSVWFGPFGRPTATGSRSCRPIGHVLEKRSNQPDEMRRVLAR